jgi:hypothetical protein
MKEKCEGVIQALIDELHQQFPTHDVMIALGSTTTKGVLVRQVTSLDFE